MIRRARGGLQRHVSSGRTMSAYDVIDEQIALDAHRAGFRASRGCMCRVFLTDRPCEAWSLTLRCPATERVADYRYGRALADLELELDYE